MTIAQRRRIISARYVPGVIGVPAPSGLDGSPTLFASWDFDNAPSITLSGGDIDSIAGVDGTSHTLLTPGNMPSQETDGDGKKSARFTIADSEFMQIAGDLGVVPANGATIVVVGQIVTGGANHVMAELANGAAASNSSRFQLGAYVSASIGPRLRKNAVDAVQGSTYSTAARMMFLGTGNAGTAASDLRVNTNEYASGTTVNWGGTPSHFTLGATRSGGAESSFFGGKVNRVFVYSPLTPTARGQLWTYLQAAYTIP